MQEHCTCIMLIVSNRFERRLRGIECRRCRCTWHSCYVISGCAQAQRQGGHAAGFAPGAAPPDHRIAQCTTSPRRMSRQNLQRTLGLDFRILNTVPETLMGPFNINITISSIRGGQRLHKQRTTTHSMYVHVCMEVRRPEPQAFTVHESRRGWLG